MSYIIEGRTGPWELVIGLEVHAQVVSHAKLFSGASAEYGGEPNAHVSFVDAGFPGMLPVINRECVAQAVRTGLGLKAQINLVSRFDRKNYFYADLPQGYQISQFAHPIVGAGVVDIELESGEIRHIGVTRLHLEQDAGKSMHDQHPAQSFIDVNLTGTLHLLEAARAAGHDRFIFTSTTSLMISDAIRREEADHAIWLDEESGPLAPRNIYGVTKLGAEGLCRLYHLEHGLACVILRTGRFFPEEDDTHRALSGENMKANEFLNRRLTVEDAAAAHVAALTRAPALGFGLYVIAAPTPFKRADAEALRRDAPGVIARYYPEAAALYAARGWRLPETIGRVYDASLAERSLGFRAETAFGTVLHAMANGTALPFAHDPRYVSPKEAEGPAA